MHHSKISSDDEDSILNNTLNSFFEKPIIILVDDNDIINQSNKKILSEFLKENNLIYELIMGNDGLDIIKLVLKYENKYNLIKFIITDENMDYYQGTEAIAFIRKFEKIKKLINTKIISLTCHEDVNIINNIIKIGANSVLSKPLTKNMLRLCLLKE